jgi:hypothetical protein
MVLWVFVYLGTTPIGSIVTGWIISASGPRVALLVGSGAALPLPRSRPSCRRRPIRTRL